MRFSFLRITLGQKGRCQLRMRIGQIRIDFQGALILRDRRIELPSFVEKGAVSVEQTRGRFFWSEANGVLVFSASFVRPAEALEKISITGTDFPRAGIELDRAGVIFFGLIPLS